MWDGHVGLVQGPIACELIAGRQDGLLSPGRGPLVLVEVCPRGGFEPGRFGGRAELQHVRIGVARPLGVQAVSTHDRLISGARLAQERRPATGLPHRASHIRAEPYDFTTVCAPLGSRKHRLHKLVDTHHMKVNDPDNSPSPPNVRQAKSTADLTIKETGLMPEAAVENEQAEQVVEAPSGAVSDEQLVAMLVDRARNEGCS